jgi:hypothetical protein
MQGTYASSSSPGKICTRIYIYIYIPVKTFLCPPHPLLPLRCLFYVHTDLYTQKFNSLKTNRPDLFLIILSPYSTTSNGPASVYLHHATQLHPAPPSPPRPHEPKRPRLLRLPHDCDSSNSQSHERRRRPFPSARKTATGRA